jgi:hydrogenase nickel incorporation protein HypA/HybF
MHELSVCNALLQQVEKIAAEHGARKVTRIELGVGPLSGIEPKLLRNAYPIAVAGTVAEHAELVITDFEIRVSCTECNAETPATPNRLLCGECGGFRTRVISGDEMVLQRVELDEIQA